MLSWLASAYLIATAACQPLAGRLTDIFSRRMGLIVSNVLFAVGCLICSLARNEWVLIVGRAVSGAGGGGLGIISTLVSSDLVPLRNRGLWQGLGNIMYGLGMSLGGFAGGWINDLLGWRWVFLLQIPFILISGILVSLYVKIPVKETKTAAWRRIDYWGAMLLTFSLVLLLLGVNTGGNQLPWSSPFVLTMLSLAVISLSLFILVENRWAEEPIIPIRLFLHRTVWTACLTNIFSTMVTFIILFYIPLYLQIGGLSAEATGRRLIPNAAAMSSGSLITGLIMRTTGRYYLMNGILSAVFIGGIVLLNTLSFASPAWKTFVFLLPGGFAYGGMLTIMLVALIAAVDHKDQAVVTSMSYAFRSVGSTTGVAIGSAVFQNRLGRALHEVLAHVPGREKIIAQLKDDYHTMERLPASLRQLALDGYMEAFRATFLAALALVVAAGFTSLFVREHKLYASLTRDRA